MPASPLTAPSPALQIAIHATTSSDLPAVLHALNTHYLSADFTTDDTHPLADLQIGHTYVTRADVDVEHLATALVTTAPNTAFELSTQPDQTREGVSITYHPDTGLFRARCNANGTPLIPAEEVRQALYQAPADMTIGVWLSLYAPALLGTRVRAALARAKAHPQHHAFRYSNQTPDHGEDARCGACAIAITWHYDDPGADTPYGHWLDSEDRDLCPAADENADDQSHMPAPTPADFHQAALFLPPDPADPEHSFPITALAGLRIGAYIDDTYTLNIGVLDETAHPVLRTTPDGQLAVDLRIDSVPLRNPGPVYTFTRPATHVRFTVRADDEASASTLARSLDDNVRDVASLRHLGVEVTEITFADASNTHHDEAPTKRPDEAADPEWTVTGVRWKESPEDVDALTVLPGTQEPAGHNVSDQLSSWVLHLRAPDADTALRRAEASAASPQAVATFRAGNNTCRLSDGPR